MDPKEMFGMISILYNAGIVFEREYDAEYRFHRGIERLPLLLVLALLGMRCIWGQIFGS